MDAVSIGEVLSAAVHGDVEKLRLLAEEDPNCIDLFNEEGCSPLMYAAANGRESAIRYLLANKANVERRNRYGWTALLQVHELTVIAQKAIPSPTPHLTPPLT